LAGVTEPVAAGLTPRPCAAGLVGPTPAAVFLPLRERCDGTVCLRSVLEAVFAAAVRAAEGESAAVIFRFGAFFMNTSFQDSCIINKLEK